MKFWVVVTSRDHALEGAKEGIIQVNHGKNGPLKRLSPGDKILLYAGKRVYGQKELSQSFVALAAVTDESIFRCEVSENFKPYRRKARYIQVKESEIRPLIDKLEFIKNKEKWGFCFRTGFFEINKHDFDLISSHMYI
jgi:predicted RNA-binding protein